MPACSICPLTARCARGGRPALFGAGRINPRAFDAMLGVDAAVNSAASASDRTRATAASDKLNNSAVCRTIQAAWRRTEWLAIGVQTDRGIVAEAVAHYSTDGLSQGAQHLLASMSGPPELLVLPRRTPSRSWPAASRSAASCKR